MNSLIIFIIYSIKFYIKFQILNYDINFIGNLRVRVLFSEPLPIDLTMMLYCEFPATLFVGKTGKLGGSYL